jgi:hypothetical protein
MPNGEEKKGRELHGKVEREVNLGEAMPNGEEKKGRELEGVTTRRNRGSAASSSRLGKRAEGVG